MPLFAFCILFLCRVIVFLVLFLDVELFWSICHACLISGTETGQWGSARSRHQIAVALMKRKVELEVMLYNVEVFIFVSWGQTLIWLY
jgi:hypothetical protein